MRCAQLLAAGCWVVLACASNRPATNTAAVHAILHPCPHLLHCTLLTVQGRRTRAVRSAWHPSLLHKNASLPLELRFCFHQHHRPSKSDCSMRHHFYTSCTPSHSSSISRVHIVLITHTRPNLQHQLHFCDHSLASMYSPIRLCFSSKVICSTRHRPHQRIPLSRAAPSVGSHACSTSVLLDRMQGRTLGASAPASDH